MNPELLKSITLFGGMEMTVSHSDGSSEKVKVRQLPLEDYQRGFQIMQDEFAFTALCTVSTEPNGKPMSKEWVMTLKPESYEELHTAAKEVNEGGFFIFAGRRNQQERDAQKTLFAALAELPPDTLKLLEGMGKSADISQMPLPRPRSIPG